MVKDTRQKILNATSHLFERQGYHATGLNEIVKESGTPRGSLYYYFPEGKEEIASESVKQRMAYISSHADEVMQQFAEPAEAVYALILGIMNNMGESCGTGAPIAAVALEASNTSERIRTACAKGYQDYQDVVAKKLIEGGFSEEKAQSLALTIHAAIEGVMILSRTSKNVTLIENMANDMKFLIEFSSKN